MRSKRFWRKRVGEPVATEGEYENRNRERIIVTFTDLRSFFRLGARLAPPNPGLYLPPAGLLCLGQVAVAGGLRP